MNKFLACLALLSPSLVTFADETVMGGIPQEKIDEAIKKAMPKFRACYDKQPNPDHKLSGTVSTRFTIGADGKVAEAGVLKSTLNDKATENCVIGELKQLTFAKPVGGGIVEVEYPFSFSQKKIH